MSLTVKKEHEELWSFMASAVDVEGFTPPLPGQGDIDLLYVLLMLLAKKLSS